jgi:indolepyruvate ferredoxin oxidoreductase beta subunit
MKKDIILAGVGGQGILTVAAVIGYAALSSNLYVKQSEVHGMSQRGGDVQSHLRISDKEIASDLIPMGKADMIISLEPMEALRYLPMLAQDGMIITNTTPFINIPNYPDLNDILKILKGIHNSITIDADNIAKELKISRSANMIILGKAINYLDIPFEKFNESIKFMFAKKDENIINANILALKTGYEFNEK